ncbi:MAG: hypothetical protein RLZZ450_710 [Pseudomonadota bacterium]|jgi:hypothetical protein
MPRRQRERKPTPAEDQPLDDGTRTGIESWRVIGAVSFCHWDRWLLRLALDEPQGLRSIEREFRRRATVKGSPNRDAEAMLAQVTDLQARLHRLELAPESVLDNVERASNWLLAKAHRRVWHGRAIYNTEAMLNTPRVALEARALRGNWAAFPVSPASYAAPLKAIVGSGYYDYRGVGLITMQIEMQIDRMLYVAKSDAERLAIHRAALTAVIEMMDQVDDSDADMAILFRSSERAYLELLRGPLQTPRMLRDLLELVVWEDYGLFAEGGQFVGALTEDKADLVVIELARMLSELRAAGLDYQAARVRALRKRVLASVEDRELLSPSAQSE